MSVEAERLLEKNNKLAKSLDIALGVSAEAVILINNKKIFGIVGRDVDSLTSFLEGLL